MRKAPGNLVTVAATLLFLATDLTRGNAQSAPAPDDSATVRVAVTLAPTGPRVGSPGPLFQGADGVDRREPLLAGLLSFWILPGLGSFYAGNGAHGVRHVAIEMGGSAAMVFGALGGDWSLIYAGLGGIVVNRIWSCATAVNDATAHNRGSGAQRLGGRVVGGVFVDPEARVLGSRVVGRDGVVRSVPRLGLRLLSLRFQ